MIKMIATNALAYVLATTASLALAHEAPALNVIELFLMPEHIPENLKAGDKIDLKMVTGKAGVGKRTLYMSQTMAADLEVKKVSRMEKPDEHGRSIRVELVAAAMATKTIEKAKAQLVTVVETVPGQGTTTKMRPVPFRLEPSKP
ncbi:MAG: hypothetical protein KJS91_01265 [Planctomycetes bacterium]|nr:hypothetical protein [Planctomycetota bacterium]